MDNKVALKMSGNFYSADKANNQLIKRIKEGIDDNIQFLFMTGGGNGNRGKEMDFTVPQYERDHLGMLHAFKNSILLYKSIKETGICNVVLATPLTKYQEVISLFEDENIKEYFLELIRKRKIIDTSPKDLNENLNLNNHIVIGGGSGYVGFSTDSAIALIAGNANIKQMLKILTDYDCVYDKDPRKNNDAKPIRWISYEDAIKNKLEVMQGISPYVLCQERDIDIRVANLDNSFLEILTKKAEIGTTITNKENILERKAVK